jgi:hypothetical protein
MSRRLIAVLTLAPVLLTAIAASSTLALRCRLTGQMMTSSLDVCCPGASDSASSDVTDDPGNTVSDPGCCDSLVLTVAKALADEPARATLEPPTTGLVAFVAPRAPTPPSYGDSLRPEESGPPATAPPLFLSKHAFLI